MNSFFADLANKRKKKRISYFSHDVTCVEVYIIFTHGDDGKREEDLRCHLPQTNVSPKRLTKSTLSTR